MRRLRQSRFISALVLALLLQSFLPLTAIAQAPATETAPALTSQTLDQARELIRNGDYDDAIDLLKKSVDRARERTSELREAYLLLIKTYVFIGNDLKFKPQGREASNLNYERAKSLITECLSIPELRHTTPEPVSEFPPEMITFFSEVRGQIFGSFRVITLEPADALVMLDGDTLGTLPDEELLGDIDLAVGKHLVVVRAQGYQDVTDEVTISPNATLERAYRMSKKRGAAWYAVAASGAAGVVWGLAALLSGSDSTPAPDEPLPGPPDPPSSP